MRGIFDYLYAPGDGKLDNVYLIALTNRCGSLCVGERLFRAYKPPNLYSIACY